MEYLIAPATVTDAELALFVPHRADCAVMANPGVATCSCGAMQHPDLARQAS